MNLKEFLEEENRKFEEEFEDKSDERYGIAKHINTMVDRQVDWINYHDTRLINKVLSEVQSEVEKIEILQDNSDYELAQLRYREKISTIINNLKVK